MLNSREILKRLASHPDPLVVKPWQDHALTRDGAVIIRLGDGWTASPGGVRPRYVKSEVFHSKDYAIKPRELILATTQEFVGLPRDLYGVTMFKSSLARMGLAVTTFGIIDPGYQGNLVIEICNMGTQPVRLQSGMSILELRLFTGSEPPLDAVDHGFKQGIAKTGGQHVMLDIAEASLNVSSAVTDKLIAYFAAHPAELRTMNRRLFEEFIAELWQGFGYEVELTAQTRDGGKDIIAVRNDVIQEKLLIECKRPNPGTILGVRTVRELLGVKTFEGATKAILATTAFFSNDAKLLFEKMRWELEGREFDGLQDWIRKYLKTKGTGKW